MRLLRYLLFLSALPRIWAAANPTDIVLPDNPFKLIEDSAVYSPSSNRMSPFNYPEDSKGQTERAFSGKRIGLGEMLGEFVKPKGLVEQKSTREVFINNHFYVTKDVMRLEISKDANNYEYPIVELVVTGIGSDYVDLFYRPNQSSHRITFQLNPELTNEDTKSNLVGASLRLLGTESKVFQGNSEFSAETSQFKTDRLPTLPKKSQQIKPPPPPVKPMLPGKPAGLPAGLPAKLPAGKK